MERLESELEELDNQTESLANLESELLDEPIKEEMHEFRPKSASTLGSDSEDVSWGIWPSESSSQMKLKIICFPIYNKSNS